MKALEGRTAWEGRTGWLCAAALLLCCGAWAQEKSLDDLGISKREIVYKRVGDVELRLHIFEPKKRGADLPGPAIANPPAPAIVFFFGGGWVGGNPNQFFPHCGYLASRGMVAISAEYRIKNTHGTTPFECVADGKSAVRYVRTHAAHLGIDPDRIAAGGGSAGGHVAACTGAIEGHEQEGEDPAVSSRPNAMILFNPVIDTTKRGYGANKVVGRETEISPAHHVKKGIPPTLILHGTADTTVPFENAERFTSLMKEAGNACELVAYPDRKHGFFNYNKKTEDFEATLGEAEKFLTSLGYLKKGPPTAAEYMQTIAATPALTGKAQKARAVPKQ